ncbi:molybdenum cofactor guanylyltransferase [Rhodopila sp.]|uniref:molybdenum cofactor guanylyltransferase n=1 Tax=Rhodopila sp. TaxID=2480087 RepID=UPI002C560FE0|nr:molybdenum cofactor guanylyltransferase [Rhodopila sp.]HVZ08427.1 molybdenum cofactor guanylyltransferase [Rhodopila sp.]
MRQIAGLVLAGGAARRMGGGDKPLRLLLGRPLLDYALAGLDTPLRAISANGEPGRFGRYGLPVLPDGPFAGRGPLAGILAGLDWAAGQGAELLLTVPGDTPFLPPDLSRRLIPAPACARSDGQAHYLTAMWRVSDRAALRAFLSNPGSPRVSRFADKIGLRRIDIAMEHPLWFVNINTLQELADLETMASRQGGAIAPPPSQDR